MIWYTKERFLQLCIIPTTLSMKREKQYKCPIHDTLIKVKIIPQAKYNQIENCECLTNSSSVIQCKIRVTTAPEKHRANKAAIKLLSEKLKIAQSCISIVSGTTSRNKIMKISSMLSADTIEKLLR